MIISTKKGTPKIELEKIVDKFEAQGLDVTLISGKDYNVFGLVGDTTKIDERDVLANPWIDNVTRVSAPYGPTGCSIPRIPSLTAAASRWAARKRSWSWPAPAPSRAKSTACAWPRP